MKRASASHGETKQHKAAGKETAMAADAGGQAMKWPTEFIRRNGFRAAAAVLTVTCTAGCSVFQSPAAPAGMQKQIIMGERVSAASQAHVSQLASGLAVKPARSSRRPPAQRRVLGRQVTAIGDSVMAASAMALESELPGIYIDAKPSRQMPAGLEIVRTLAASGRLRPVVVMGLGTNYIVTTAQLRELMRLIGPDRRLVLINTYVPDGWSKQVNATEAAFIGRHPGVVPADWFDTIRNRTYLLWPDQVHPQMPGTTVYAAMVFRAVQATRDVPSSVPAAQPVVAGAPAR